MRVGVSERAGKGEEGEWDGQRSRRATVVFPCYRRFSRLAVVRFGHGLIRHCGVSWVRRSKRPTAAGDEDDSTTFGSNARQARRDCRVRFPGQYSTRAPLVGVRGEEASAAGTSSFSISRLCFCSSSLRHFSTTMVSSTPYQSPLNLPPRPLPPRTPLSSTHSTLVSNQHSFRTSLYSPLRPLPTA